MKTTEKTCFKCGQSKPLSDFYKHPRMADGHLNKCKECAKADVHEHRHGKGREKVLAYDRMRGLRQPKEYFKEYAQRFPDRYKARNSVNNAVRDGRLIKLPCFLCGEKAEAHHPDYSDPLNPVWLCPAHHKQAHALTNKIMKGETVGTP